MFASEIKAFTANPYFEKELNKERIPDISALNIYLPMRHCLKMFIKCRRAFFHGQGRRDES